MNAFNRFLVILLAATGIFLWLAAIFLVWFFPGELTVALRDLAGLLRTSTLLVQGGLTAFGVSSILVALLILVGELTPRQSTEVQLTHVTNGTAAVSVDAIAQRLKSALEQMPQVSMARPKISNFRNAIDVLVELRSEPEAHLSAQADEVCQAVRAIVEEQLGVRLRNVRVTFHNDGHDGREQNPRMTAGKEKDVPASEQILVPETAPSEEPAPAQEEGSGTSRL